MRRHPRRTAVIVAVTALTLLIAGLFGLIRDRGDETARPPAAAPGTPMPSLKPRPSGASGQARPSPGAPAHLCTGTGRCVHPPWQPAWGAGVGAAGGWFVGGRR